jgi:uncharacterized protein (TIGR03067 family)
MRRYAVLILVAGALIAAEKKKEAPKKDVDLMQGSWTVEEAAHNGETAGEDKLAELKIAIKGAKLSVSTGEDAYQVPFKLDPTKKPKTIDAAPKGGLFGDKELKGIYEIKGDSLKMCFAESGKDRPTEFKSEADSGHILLVLKRKKAD